MFQPSARVLPVTFDRAPEMGGSVCSTSRGHLLGEHQRQSQLVRGQSLSHQCSGFSTFGKTSLCSAQCFSTRAPGKPGASSINFKSSVRFLRWPVTLNEYFLFKCIVVLCSWGMRYKVGMSIGRFCPVILVTSAKVIVFVF